MKLFLDDLRYEPKNWQLVNTVKELEEVFIKNKSKVTHISLDNSLGWGVPQGKTFVDDFINNQWYVDNLWIHSSDFVAVDYMKDQLDVAKKSGVISPNINVKIVSYPDDFE
ncbi:cyclic-phosphate processing receiver domain-containing protein [Companilactobacillus sp. DQM5]|uniref:cyclic-phosphate processing receiver domain-containing protein n=1 Tax=Companilactobacillus sp. DQM5 TaxID=3463359 RepID=UPI004059F5D4